jgi:hypothetical protein
MPQGILPLIKIQKLNPCFPLFLSTFAFVKITTLYELHTILAWMISSRRGRQGVPSNPSIEIHPTITPDRARLHKNRPGISGEG